MVPYPGNRSNWEVTGFKDLSIGLLQAFAKFGGRSEKGHHWESLIAQTFRPEFYSFIREDFLTENHTRWSFVETRLSRRSARGPPAMVHLIPNRYPSICAYDPATCALLQFCLEQSHLISWRQKYLQSHAILRIWSLVGWLLPKKAWWICSPHALQVLPLH